MIVLVVKIISFIKLIVVSVIGFILSFILMFIPTLLFNPNKHINYIEKDICIDFPENYTVINKSADWFAFEEHYQIKFEFDNNEFINILNQLETNLCQNGKWSESDGQLRFSTDNNFLDKNNYLCEVLISREDQTLEYRYGSF